MTVLLFAVLGYVAVQLGIGIWVGRRVRTQEDYLLGGRKLGPALATFTVFATWFGAEACLGAAGAIYRDGLAGATADPFGYALCLLLMGVVFAAPLWASRVITLADLLRKRFSPAVERLAVLLLVPSSLLWAAAQIRAFGQVLSASSQLEVSWTMTIAAIVVIAYTATGGLLADAITDVVQGLVLMLGLLWLFAAVMSDSGGVIVALSSVDATRVDLVPDDMPLLTIMDRWAIPILGSVVAQELVSRVCASRSGAVARGATFTGAGLYLIMGLVPVILGLLGPQLVPGLLEPEQLLPRLAERQLGSIGYVMFAGALVSAILSTVDSALLAAGAYLSQNLLFRLIPEQRAATKVAMSRACVITCGVIAYVLALRSDDIRSLVVEASGFASAGVFVVVSFALFSQRNNAVAAGAALVTGAVLGWATSHVVAMLVSLAVFLLADELSRRRQR